MFNQAYSLHAIVVLMDTIRDNDDYVIVREYGTRQNRVRYMTDN